MADKKGKIKCQISNNIDPASLFTEVEIEIIRNISIANYSLPADTLVTDCEYNPSLVNPTKPTMQPAPSSSPTSDPSSSASSGKVAVGLVGIASFWVGAFWMNM